MAEYQNDFYDPDNPNPQAPKPPAQAQPANRWSHHLANNPYGDETVGNWAKQYYDNPDIDPGAAVQGELSRFRGQYGSDAPGDDISALRMIASGQAPEHRVQQPNAPIGQRMAAPAQTSYQTSSFVTPPQATNQFPVQPLPQQVATVQESPRNDELYNTLMARIKQPLNVDRNNPEVRDQADAYAANEQRERRNYLASAAERGGLFHNTRGEERRSAEAVGQRTGSMEASLVANVIQNKRNEIQSALSQAGGMLSQEQQLGLQRELGLLDVALRSQLGNAQIGLGQDQLALNRELGIGQRDLGFADLGLRSEQQAAYWDWIRRGGNLGN